MVIATVGDAGLAIWYFYALVSIWIAGLTNDVYFQIGLVTLLGLASKNAILIVEYALMKYQQGWSPTTAALEAARLRFRPIIMTSLAFILGVVPLVLSSGAGAEQDTVWVPGSWVACYQPRS